MKKLHKWLNLNPRLGLLIPYIIIALVFIAIPIILIISVAFEPHKDVNTWEVAKSLSTWKIIWRSIKLGTIAAFISLIIGLPYAYFIHLSDSKQFKIIGMALIVSPTLIFTIARIYAVRGLFQSIIGENNLNAEWFMILGMVYINLPLMIIPIYSVLNSMPKNIIEASESLGYSKFRSFFKVVIPYCIKSIVSGLILIFISSASSITISNKLLPNPNKFQLAGNIIYDYANPGNPVDLSIASTIVIVVSLSLYAITILIYLVPKLIMKMKGMSYEQH
ncbi:ABC transporter permease [Mycoplasma sp. Mirounga ES2805-ORL]|uniref:ABC transporter permease n=1 Tax=Mycoplasma sp. Mirounga ES2805-ORL TaxID=754514 RepID=UPI00197C6A33|nr:ABC transporter permease subunit [Mycoplasma sp. Mirounga ES2805-ORL]QSF13974.1 ABC transporter permease subunit [Mycoplasma sp. Mirounga ES2805-ORL]